MNMEENGEVEEEPIQKAPEAVIALDLVKML